MTRAEQDELIIAHLPQSEMIAVSIYVHIGKRMPLEDLKQYGAMGLVVAAAHFDASLGFKFKTYAEHRIRGFIFDGIRKETRRRSTQKNGIEPILVPLEPTVLSRPDPAAQHDFVAIEAKVDVERVTACLTRKQRQAVKCVYLQEKTRAKTAKQMGLSATWVGKLLVEAQERMRPAA